MFTRSASYIILLARIGTPPGARTYYDAPPRQFSFKMTITYATCERRYGDAAGFERIAIYVLFVHLHRELFGSRTLVCAPSNVSSR